MLRKALSVVFVGALSLCVVSCGNIGCGVINAECRVTVLNHRGQPVPGVEAIWIDKGDDRFWRSPNSYAICITDSTGSCSGVVAHRISRVTYGWSTVLPKTNYSIAVMSKGRTTGTFALEHLPSAQVSGSQPISINVDIP